MSPLSSVPESAAWWKEAVFYQIYPRSFADSNGDGIGDLAGITGKLDYIKRLGVDALWISPIYQSPNDDNGYDISDYTAVGTEYGTLEDFLGLTAGLRERGLKLILDQVLNHTSDEHAWFVESRSSRDNPKRDWYHWVDAKGFDAEGRPLLPNNWRSVFGGSAWEWDERTRQFYLHCFSRKQPDLNWRNPEVRRACRDVLKTWVARGTDGFRLDVINMIAKQPGYPDVPRPAGNTEPFLNLDTHGVNQPPIHDYLREMNREVFEGKDLYAVGETWWVDSTNTLDYTAYDRRELNGCFYFYFHGCKTGREHFDEFMKLYRVTRGKSWLTVTLGNHDSRRILSKFGDPVNHRYASATLLATWLLTLPATPFLFQGEELGLTDMTYDRIEDYSDIQTVNNYHALVAKGKTPAEALAAVQADSRDNSRTPMPWDDSPGGGFSEGKPWLRIPDVHRPLHAAGAEVDATSIYHGYAALLALRKKVKSLVYGELTPLTDVGNVLAYRREAWNGHPAVTVVLNWSGESQPWPVTAPTGDPLFSNCGEVDAQ
ncbi:MAG: alpha-glucosidase, partial [Rariglobus sp.]